MTHRHELIAQASVCLALMASLACSTNGQRPRVVPSENVAAVFKAEGHVPAVTDEVTVSCHSAQAVVRWLVANSSEKSHDFDVEFTDKNPCDEKDQGNGHRLPPASVKGKDGCKNPEKCGGVDLLQCTLTCSNQPSGVAYYKYVILVDGSPTADPVIRVER